MTGERSGLVRKGLMCGVGLFMMACTSARETNEYNATVPNTIQSDADRRAIYNNAPVTKPIPRQPALNNQASEINRKKNIEERQGNNPNNEPLEVRTREMQTAFPDSYR